MTNKSDYAGAYDYESFRVPVIYDPNIHKPSSQLDLPKILKPAKKGKISRSAAVKAVKKAMKKIRGINND